MDMNEETKNKEGGAVCKFFCKNPIIYFVVTAIICIFLANDLYRKCFTLYLWRIRDFLSAYIFELIIYVVLGAGLAYIADKCGKVEKDIFNMSREKQESVANILRIIEKICTGICVIILVWSAISLKLNGYGFVLSTIIAKGRSFIIFDAIGYIAVLYGNFIFPSKESQDNDDTSAKSNVSKSETSVRKETVTNENENPIAEESDEAVEEKQQEKTITTDTAINVAVEQKSVKKNQKNVKKVIVAVVAIGLVLIGISKFSNKDIVDKGALEYFQNATYNGESATLKEVFENYWHGGKWYVYKAYDERGIERTVVEYALDKNRSTCIRFWVDEDANSIEPIDYTENYVSQCLIESQFYEQIQRMYDTYYAEVGVQ